MNNALFKAIKDDHQEAKSILEQLSMTKESDLEKREELFKTFRIAFIPHQKAEEKTFYKPLLQKKASRDPALEGMEEHHVADLVLKELEQQPKDKDQWGAKMSVFKELVEHHVQEEESEVFKSATKALSPDEFPQILKQFEEEKQKLKAKGV
ncbi:hemerythrin domain-containing protein [Solidesulfovibrio sp.]|uniref:hemerythrin domain-containing protein n=1 Tax=Solidesulfovibrio sp. TaxID=2910990 RepID=UPI002637A83F|nr:hemerythrin domain-containing protein [Solidesulfovibrio sp.]